MTTATSTTTPGASRATGACAGGGCRAAGRIAHGGDRLCRDHWREWRVRSRSGEPFLGPDLDEVYGRREATGYVNRALKAAGHRPLSLGYFLYDGRSGLRLEPLRLGERTGGIVADGRYAQRMVFTRRLLDAFIAARLAGERGAVRPTEAERDAFMEASAAVAWLNDWWAARGIDYRVSRATMFLHRAAGRLPAVDAGGVMVYHRLDLAALAEAIEVAGGWEARAKHANIRHRTAAAR